MGGRRRGQGQVVGEAGLGHSLDRCGDLRGAAFCVKYPGRDVAGRDQADVPGLDGIVDGGQPFDHAALAVEGDDLGPRRVHRPGVIALSHLVDQGRPDLLAIMVDLLGDQFHAHLREDVTVHRAAGRIRKGRRRGQGLGAPRRRRDAAGDAQQGRRDVEEGAARDLAAAQGEQVGVAVRLGGGHQLANQIIADCAPPIFRFSSDQRGQLGELCFRVLGIRNYRGGGSPEILTEQADHVDLHFAGLAIAESGQRLLRNHCVSGLQFPIGRQRLGQDAELPARRAGVQREQRGRGENEFKGTLKSHPRPPGMRELNSS